MGPLRAEDESQMTRERSRSVAVLAAGLLAMSLIAAVPAEQATAGTGLDGGTVAPPAGASGTGTSAASGTQAQGGGKQYTAPYRTGPSGGDQFNLLHAGEDGRIVVGRFYPVVSVISCNAKGGFATYEITHRATAPVKRVTVAFAEAAVDPYTFVVVNVIDRDGSFLGSLHRRGPLTGDGELKVPVRWGGRATPRRIRVQFGLQLTSACPSADLGTVRFASVSVNR